MSGGRVSHTETRQVVLPVNVHSAAPADTLAATPPEHERRVVLVLDLEQRVEHHLARLVQVQLVVLQPRLLRRVVRVPAVHLERLHPLRLLRGGVADRRHAAPRDEARRGAERRGERGAEDAGCGRAESRHCGEGRGLFRRQREGAKESLQAGVYGYEKCAPGVGLAGLGGWFGRLRVAGRTREFSRLTFCRCFHDRL